MKRLDQIGIEKDISLKQHFYPTGIKLFDKKFGGLAHGVNLIAARPGMGLTTLSTQIIANTSSEHKSLYITLDLTSIQLCERIRLYKVTNPSNIYLEDQVHSAVDILKYLTDITSDFSIISIDSFQFIDFDICYQLFIKQLDGIANNRAILLQYKLGRSVEERGGDKIPTISDLNDHYELKTALGSLNYLYRPGYYGITEDEDGQNIEETIIIGGLSYNDIIEI